MRLCVDETSLTRSKAGIIAGQLWVESGAIAFPAAGWYDIVVVVLGWWLRETATLVVGGQRIATIRFMDGPVWVSKQRDEWHAEFVEEGAAGSRIVHECTFAPDPLLRTLLSCSEAVLEECGREKWKSPDIEGLRQQRERLSQALTTTRKQTDTLRHPSDR